MQLYVTHSSPYARKCRMVVYEKGAKDAVEEVITVPLDNPSILLQANPAAQVPALILGNGTSLTGSALICDYLDAHLDGPKLSPSDPAAFWAARQFHSQVDAGLDACVRLVQENLRKPETRSKFWSRRWRKAIDRILDGFEAIVEPPHADVLTMSDIALISLLDYIDFRHPRITWQEEHPKLAAFQENCAARTSVQETMPA